MQLSNTPKQIISNLQIILDNVHDYDLHCSSWIAGTSKISGLQPCNGLNIADNEAQWIVHFSDDKGLGISDVVCVGSPVIITLFTKKKLANKYTKKIGP